MNEMVLETIREWIQIDIGRRGLRTDPSANLITACADDFQAACRSLADTAKPAVVVLTGFFIPDGQPPCAETDGPLGAVFLARALARVGIEVILVTDPWCRDALEAGLDLVGLPRKVMLVTDFSHAPTPREPPYKLNGQPHPPREPTPLTHLIALERAGPSHTLQSIRATAFQSEETLARDVMKQEDDALGDHA
ncbi:MAG: DUF4392 domain-containing protein, partial [Gemmataceae bacterium]|nr:DUF4392 domain-containing protein [Gemmataceae bacterium]